ncbi:hypothetical protein AAY473_016115, partial [Plecturocebus cupreus]
MKEIKSSVPQSHPPHFKHSAATSGQWFLHWTVRIQDIPMTLESSSWGSIETVQMEMWLTEHLGSCFFKEELISSELKANIKNKNVEVLEENLLLYILAQDFKNPRVEHPVTPGFHDGALSVTQAEVQGGNLGSLQSPPLGFKQFSLPQPPKRPVTLPAGHRVKQHSGEGDLQTKRLAPISGNQGTER